MTIVDLKFSNKFQGELTTAKGKYDVGVEEGNLTPYDMLLGALGGCFYATFIDIVKKMQLEYESAEIHIEGKKRDDKIATLETVDFDFTLYGADESNLKKYQRAVELAAKYCSIHETISKVADIKLNLKLK